MTKPVYVTMVGVYLLCAASVHADSGEIISIRTRYNETKRLIKNKALFHDRFLVNKNNTTWPAVGNYQETFDIYYSLCDEREVHNYPNERCIYLIEVTTTASVSTSKTEFLFDKNDSLIFIYYRDGYKNTDERYYLRDGKLIRYSINDQVHDRQIESRVNKTVFENLQRQAYRWAKFLKKR